MAWAHNATSTDYSTDTSLTFAHTVGAGANRILVVEAAMFFVPEDGNVSGITYNGVALTKIRGDSHIPGAYPGARTELWYLLNPPSGSHNVVVSFAGTYMGTGSDGLWAGASDYTGITQTSPVRSSQASNGSNSTDTGGITATADDLVVMVGLGADALTAVTPMTERWNATNQAGGDANASASSRNYGWATHDGVASFAFLIPSTSGILPQMQQAHH